MLFGIESLIDRSMHETSPEYRAVQALRHQRPRTQLRSRARCNFSCAHGCTSLRQRGTGCQSCTYQELRIVGLGVEVDSFLCTFVSELTFFKQVRTSE